MKVLLDETQVIFERTGKDTFKVILPDIPCLACCKDYDLNIGDTITVMIPNVIVDFNPPESDVDRRSASLPGVTPYAWP